MRLKGKIDPNENGGHLDPRDKKKSHWELTMEIEELKKRKNRDFEDIKLVKVELHKMQVLYKKYKELLSQQPGIQTNLGTFQLSSALPFSLSDQDGAALGEVAQWLSTEELLVETAKIKNLLQKDILQRKRIQANEQRRVDSISANPAVKTKDENRYQPKTCYDCKESEDILNGSASDIFLSGHAKSNLRVQLAHLKDKQVVLEKQLQTKDEEILKVKEQGSEQARKKTREELERAFTVLKHIKKKVGSGFYDAEYNTLVEEVQLIQREDHHHKVIVQPE